MIDIKSVKQGDLILYQNGGHYKIVKVRDVATDVIFCFDDLDGKHPIMVEVDNAHKIDNVNCIVKTSLGVYS